jgi:DDE_Tnp_1-associated
MVPFSRLLAALSEVPDPRRAQGKRYPLPYLLLFTILALLSGAESYRGIITFLDQRRGLLNRYFGVTLQRAPALNTLRNLLQSLDGDIPQSRQRLAARRRSGCQAGDRAGRQDATRQLRSSGGS